jgi:hypothetical protein
VPRRGRMVLAFVAGIASGMILLLAAVWFTAP